MNNRESRGIFMYLVSLPLSSKLAMAALVTMAAAEFIGVLLSQGEHPPVALVIELLLLALAGLVYTRKWWASGLATALSGVFVILAVPSSISALTESRVPDMVFAVVFLGLALVATVAGFQATVQNFRDR